MSISCLSLTHLLLGALNAIVFSFWVKLFQKKECLTRLAVHNGSVTYIYLKIVCCISDCKIEDALQLNAKLHSKRELCVVRNDTCRTYDVYTSIFTFNQYFSHYFFFQYYYKFQRAQVRREQYTTVIILLSS